MQVFVTGATGFVGSAIAQELLAAGHRVLGLARSETAAAALAAAGVEPHHGSLEEPASLRAGAARADGVIHTAFNHDFTRFKANCEADRQVIAALGAELAGSERLLVVTSGTGLLPPGVIATEEMLASAGSTAIPRIASEEAAHAVLQHGTRVAVVRLPPSVHGDGDHGFVPLLIGIARSKGTAAYIGEGLNRWPAVHRLDAARLYRLVIEHGAAGRYHGVAEGGIAFRAITEVIGRRLNLPVAPVVPEDAAGHFGWFAHFAALDNPASSAWTRGALGWEPRQPELLTDLDRPEYFAV
jgi:nucleoside-diphosphate-sugar epimerase